MSRKNMIRNLREKLICEYEAAGISCYKLGGSVALTRDVYVHGTIFISSSEMVILPRIIRISIILRN